MSEWVRLCLCLHSFVRFTALVTKIAIQQGHAFGQLAPHSITHKHSSSSSSSRQAKVQRHVSPVLKTRTSKCTKPSSSTTHGRTTGSMAWPSAACSSCSTSTGRPGQQHMNGGSRPAVGSQAAAAAAAAATWGCGPLAG